MNYKPSKEAENSGGGKAPEGEYPFTVKAAAEVRFRTGADGAEIELGVQTAPGRSLKVYSRLTYGEKAQWKLKAFMDSIGADFYRPPEDIAQLVGLSGRAKFVHNEKGYLEVGEYVPSSAGIGSAKLGPVPARKESSMTASDEPPPHGDDDVAF